MYSCNPRCVVVVLLSASLIAAWGELASRASAQEKKPDAAAKIVLPKDPKAVVLSYDPGAGGFIRKGAPPYLKILADGQVTVTSVFDGSQKEAKLTSKQLEELLQFVVNDKGFFNVTAAKIAAGIKEAAGNGPFIAVTGAGIAKITAEANGKKHEASYRGAAAFLRVFPRSRFWASSSPLKDV